MIKSDKKNVHEVNIPVNFEGKDEKEIERIVNKYFDNVNFIKK